MTALHHPARACRVRCYPAYTDPADCLHSLELVSFWPALLCCVRAGFASALHCHAPILAGDDIVIGKTSPIPDDGSGMPQRYSKKVGGEDGHVTDQ